jgi:hypothetical protein
MKNLITHTTLALALLLIFQAAGGQTALAAHKSKPQSQKSKANTSPKKKKSFWKKTGKAIIIVASVVAVVATAGLIAKAKSPNITKEVAKLQRLQKDNAQIAGKTPAGVPFRAALKPSAAVMAEIDKAWAHNDRIAAHFGYTRNVSRDNHELILLPQETLSKYGRVPSLAIPIGCKPATANSYCNNSDYDNGVFTVNSKKLFDQSGKPHHKYIHYITAAEQVYVETLGSGKQQYSVIVPAAETPANLQMVCYAAWFGFDHTALFNNNQAAFDSTIGAGFDTHPNPYNVIPNAPDPCARDLGLAP